MTGRSILSWRRFSYMCRIWRTPLTDKTKSNPGSKRPARNGASEKKWGAKVIALGFCILPSLLLRAQLRLGLSPTQLAVLIQLALLWWGAGRKPLPKEAVLAQPLGLRQRTVLRYIGDLA